MGDCWLRLCQIHKPRSAGHQRAQLSKLLVPAHILGTFDERIAKWERELCEYHATSSETLPESIKMSVMQSELCPQGVREHLILSGTSLTTYEEMRDEVRRIVSARAGLDALKDDAVPMEVDAVFKGKGKDKGKGKYKDKDRDKGKGKDKDKDKTQKYFDGKCRWCGRH